MRAGWVLVASLLAIRTGGPRGGSHEDAGLSIRKTPLTKLDSGTQVLEYVPYA